MIQPMILTDDADIAARDRILAELELEIDDATQFATIYRSGRPIGTAQRRRVLEKDAPAWRVFDTEGREIFRLWLPPIDPARRIKRRLAVELEQHEERAELAAQARLEKISDLVKRKRELLDQRCMTAGHGRRARIQEQIDAIAVELELLSK